MLNEMDSLELDDALINDYLADLCDGNCSIHKHYENDIKITVVDTELKEYCHVIPWAVG